MPKRVILVTGTPCVGKTSAARLLTSKLDALYVNLTELVTRKNLILGRDEERNSIIVDENRTRREIKKMIEECDKEDVIVDGHYAVNVVPEKLVTHAFVLRRNPLELRKLMEKCGFSERKLWENLAAEILDVCLFDALNTLEKGRVCEVNASGKNVEEVVAEILEVLRNSKKCRVGVVDWLTMLENEGSLDDYLKI
jgi:adenylate kinase